MNTWDIHDLDHDLQIFGSPAKRLNNGKYRSCMDDLLLVVIYAMCESLPTVDAAAAAAAADRQLTTDTTDDDDTENRRCTRATAELSLIHI